MGHAQAIEDYYVTPEEYLAGELIADERHEYVGGVVYAMSGTTSRHGQIVGNIFHALTNQLAGHRCEAFSADFKVGVRTERAQFFYYPDVVIDCGNPSDESYFAEEPRVIFEVLSESTRRSDHYEKRINYQTLFSLDVYVLVDQARMAVTVYRRAQTDWTIEWLTAETDVLELPTIACSLPLITIYKRTQLAR